ncbi:type II toxin-antitoxin system VapC family toxin [Geodermatophilus sp. DSM 44513]|uniref:type II toxin-antitoxin system VapC family toxin n=1 Tax=Geodermatophilus sp. DSM 44513 TaxID=1528104 RepID=UPI00126C6BD3|nr:type II toxin-antitoxin system VapC family toxin [Geodermatophilus sp. DSM 44513]WNV76861.1 type II toxin-antitoxin system VapC family toxin [Geodermatophilus sp. DSM 44513]
MIVADASVVLSALLLDGRAGDVARNALLSDDVHAPHLVDVEVTSAIRRRVLAGDLGPDGARASLRDLADLAITRHAHEPLLERVLDLRDSMSAHDASYVALAETLGGAVVTADARLSRAPGARCPVRLLSAS